MTTTATNRILLYNGTVVDGSGAPAQPRHSVLIEGNRIKAVEPATPPTNGDHHGSTTVIDATGKTIMPGLIDAHCHLTYGDVRAEEELDLYGSLEFRALRAAWNAQKVLRAGVTSISDPGGTGYVGVAVRDAINAGMFPGPRMTTAGRFLTTSNGIADYYPVAVGVPETSSGVLTNTQDAMIDEVRKQIKAGVDIIKIGDSIFGQHQAFSDEEVRTITELAHRLKRRVTIHARGSEAVNAAIDAGIDWIMHGELMTDAVIAKLAASGIPLCPTLTLPANTGQYGEMVGANPRRVYHYARHMEASAKVLQRARQAGVTFMAGTDSGFSLTPYGEWHARELELLVDYVGCTPLEAIKAGTSTAAKALSLAGEVGVVAPGMLADVLVVDGDPLRDIKVLQDHSRLHAIVKDGQPIDLGAPWPERTVWPFERAQIVSTVDLTWERVQGRPDAKADLRERLAGTAVRATGGF